MTPKPRSAVPRAPRTLRPYVVLKLAATLDGRIAAPDGTSKWITGGRARADVQRLRAESDAVLVGAGTVRADDPELTARTEPPPFRQPLRVVLGPVPEDARVQPALEMSGDIRGILDELGRKGVLQLLVEGGARVAEEFHRPGAVDRYVVYLTGGFLGGDDGVAMFAGAGAATMARSPARAARPRAALRRRRPSRRRTRDRPVGFVSRIQRGAGIVPLSPVEDAIAAIGRGEMVVVVDDEDRENEGDLVMAAEFATPENIAFFLAHTSG